MACVGETPGGSAALEGCCEIAVDEGQCAAMLHAGVETWQRSFDPIRVRAWLSLAVAESAETARPAILALAKLRRRGQVLRSALLLFSDMGVVPATIHELMVALGKLKDHKRNLEKRRRNAMRVSVALDRVEATPPPLVAPPQVISTRYRLELDEIAHALSKPALLVEQLHDLRKRVRRIVHLFRLARKVRAAHGERLVPRNIVEPLRALSREIGRRREALTKQHRAPDLETLIALEAFDRARLDAFIRWARRQSVGRPPAPPSIRPAA